MNRRNNSIESLVVNGMSTSDPTTILSISTIHCSRSLLVGDLAWITLSLICFSVSEASSLEDPFEEREVWEVIKGMDGDKALGPDGFSMVFFQ